MILTIIAYPSYTQYVMSARRVEGQTALLDLANRLEQFFEQHQSYESASINTNTKTDVLDSAETIGHFYQLSISYQSDTTYELKASAIGPQASDSCQELYFNSRGIKSAKMANGVLSKANFCWS